MTHRTPHAIYEKREWIGTAEDSFAIATSTPAEKSKSRRLRLLFDGGQNFKTGHGYGSFMVGNNPPIRVKHDFPIYSSAHSEWVTLIEGLRYLRANIDPSQYTINVSGDSQNVIYILQGKQHAAQPYTVELRNIAVHYLNEYALFAAYWIPRELVVRHLGH